MDFINYIKELSNKLEYKDAKFSSDGKAMNFKLREKIPADDAARFVEDVYQSAFIDEKKTVDSIDEGVDLSNRKFNHRTTEEVVISEDSIYIPVYVDALIDFYTVKYFTDIDVSEASLDDIWVMSGSDLVKYIIGKICQTQYYILVKSIRERVENRNKVLNGGLEQTINRIFNNFSSFNLGELESFMKTASEFKNESELLSAGIDAKWDGKE